jgi:Xaa-Pro aminopeptidase
MLHGRLGPFTSRQIQPGDIIITEYHSSYAGYLIASEHSFSLGEPDPAFRRLHGVMEECFSEGMASMTVGTPFSDVIAAYRAPADRNGMAYVELGIHGHGLGSCEPPTTVFGGQSGILHDHFLGQIPDVALADGMVFGQNIDVHDPSFNPNAGLMLGDTVWVTRDGPRKMTRIPAELTIL